MQALWMVLAVFFFATMGVGVKVASGSFNTFELVFYRSLVSIVFMGAIVLTRGGSLRTTVPALHAGRSLVGVLALGAFFYAIAHLPLATAIALNYMSSLWVAAFVVAGTLLYRQHGRALRQGPLLVTVLVGFLGVLLILRPTVEQNQLFAGVVGLLSGIASAVGYLQVTALGRAGEPDDRTVFYFALASTLGAGAGLLFTGFSPWAQVSWQAASWLVPIGLLASLGQWCMTRAYSRGATLVVANLQYSGILFAAMYSLAVFGDQIPLIGWLGMALIMVSGMAATVLRARALPNTAAKEY